MTDLTRRATLKMMAAAPLAAGLTWTGSEVRAAVALSQAAREESRGAFEPQFFNDDEFETVKVLADLVIPADPRSVGAVEAGVPEFIDFMMVDRPDMQTAFRGGLAWLDTRCRKFYGGPFRSCPADQQTRVLDEIAYPETAGENLGHGVVFFSRFRNLTASGFWTSKAGIEDLQYQGNVFVTEWIGCPQEALDKIGVKYEE